MNYPPLQEKLFSIPGGMGEGGTYRRGGQTMSKFNEVKFVWCRSRVQACVIDGAVTKPTPDQYPIAKQWEEVIRTSGKFNAVQHHNVTTYTRIKDTRSVVVERTVVDVIDEFYTGTLPVLRARFDANDNMILTSV